MITFVTHFVDLKPDVIQKINRARANYTSKPFFRIQSPALIISGLYKAIKKFHPESSLILLTDETTKLEVDTAIKIIRIPMATSEIDYESFKAKLYFLERHPIHSHIIFLEWDVLLQSNLDEIFLNEDRDVFFTFRNLLPMPINDGFIAVNKSGVANAIKLFSIILERYKNFISVKFRYWYGLQLILKEMFLPLFFKIKPKKIKHMRINLQGIKIGFLHGKKYNYNPLVESVDTYLPNHKVIHFSKRKKISMLPYWKKFVEPLLVE